MYETNRVVGWFSCGAASAVAIKMALAEYGSDIEIAYIDTGSEHKDNVRFRRACERWYDHEILVLKSEKYADIYDVFDQTGYLVGPGGARCTAELKKAVRHGFEQPDDLHVFGYTSDWRDAAREEQLLMQNSAVDTYFPLVERDYTNLDYS